MSIHSTGFVSTALLNWKQKKNKHICCIVLPVIYDYKQNSPAFYLLNKMSALGCSFPSSIAQRFALEILVARRNVFI